MAKGKKGAHSHKEERRKSKGEGGRAREKRKQRRTQQLDKAQLASFSRTLTAEGWELREVGRDGNCFFRSLSDQLEGHEHNYEHYRQTIVDHIEEHEDDFAPFFTWGESEEGEDKNFAEYTARMRTDGEWAGQVEVVAAAQALRVSIVVHQHDHPTYRIEYAGGAAGGKKKGNGRARGTAGSSASAEEPSSPRDLHISYHEGEHYNSVRRADCTPQRSSRGGGRRGGGAGDDEESALSERLARSVRVGSDDGADADAPSGGAGVTINV